MDILKISSDGKSIFWKRRLGIKSGPIQFFYVLIRRLDYLPDKEKIAWKPVFFSPDGYIFIKSFDCSEKKFLIKKYGAIAYATARSLYEKEEMGLRSLFKKNFQKHD